MWSRRRVFSWEGLTVVSKGSLSCSFLSPGSQAQQVGRDLYSSSFLSVTCSES